MTSTWTWFSAPLALACSAAEGTIGEVRNCCSVDMDRRGQIKRFRLLLLVPVAVLAVPGPVAAAAGITPGIPSGDQ